MIITLVIVFFGKLAVICVWLSNEVEITRYVRKQCSHTVRGVECMSVTIYEGVNISFFS